MIRLYSSFATGRTESEGHPRLYHLFHVFCCNMVYDKIVLIPCNWACFCRGHQHVWIGAVREHIFSHNSTFNHHEFTYKTMARHSADCMYVNTATNQVISEYCNQNKQYICQSVQYNGKNSFKSVTVFDVMLY